MKKIFCLIFCISLMLSSFNVDVLAEDNTVSSNYCPGMELLNSINIDTTKLNDGKITKVDFIKIVVQSLNIQPIDFTNICYDDVSSALIDSGYINAALKAGLIAESKKFFPEKEITVLEAIKIAVAATGYMPKVVVSNSDSDFAYISIAKNIKLLSQIKIADYSKAISAEIAAEILYNMLTIDIMEQTTYGGSNDYSTIQDCTILSKYHNIKIVEDIVFANEYTSLTSVNNAVTENHIQIGADVFECFLDYDYLGFRVKAFCQELEGSSRIIYMEKSKRNNIVEINAVDFERINDRTIIYRENDENKKERNLVLNPSFNYIYNGKKQMLSGMDLSKYFTFDIGEFLFIDNNNDLKYDVVLALEYKYCNVKSVGKTTNIIYDKYSADRTINMSNDEAKYKIHKVVDGKQISISINEVSADDIIQYTVSNDGLLFDLIVYDNYVVGTVSEINLDDSECVIGEGTYKISDVFQTIHPGTLLNKSGGFILSLDGTTIIDVEISRNQYMYGWVMEVEKIRKMSAKIHMKVYTQNDCAEIYELTEKIKINNGKKTKIDSAEQIENLFHSENRLIKYYVNSDGQISEIYLPQQITGLDDYTENSLDVSFKKCHGDNIETYIVKSSTNFVGGFNIGTSTYNFIVPKTESLRTDETKFGVVTGSGFYTSDKRYAVSSYDEDEFGCARATLLYSDYFKEPTIDANEPMYPAVVEDVKIALNDEDDYVCRLFVCTGQEYSYLYATSEISEYVQKNISPGDIIRYKLNVDGEMIVVKKDYDFKNHTFSEDILVADVSSPFVSKFGYAQGYLYSKGAKNVLLLSSSHLGTEIQNKKFEFSDILNYPINDTYAVYVSVVYSGDKLQSITTHRGFMNNTLSEYRNSGSAATFVVVSTVNGAGRTSVYYDISYQ